MSLFEETKQAALTISESGGISPVEYFVVSTVRTNRKWQKKMVWGNCCYKSDLTPPPRV